MSAYSNFKSYESTVTTTATLNLDRKSRQIIITNDSTVYNLQYKFNNGEDWGTLYPTETVSMHVWVRDIYLNSPSSAAVSYRIWVYG